MTDDAYRIDVVCDVGARHSKKRPEVHIVTYRATGPGWSSNLTSPSAKRHSELRGREQYRRTVLDGDKRVGGRGGLDLISAGPEAMRNLRSKDQLSCRVCERAEMEGRGKSIRLDFRESTMNALLDKIRESGLSRVSLGWLSEAASRLPEGDAPTA